MKIDRERELQAYPVPPHEVLEDEDTIDLRALFATLWRGKWIVLVCFLIASVFGFLAVSQQENRYRANAKVMFDIQESNVINLQDVLVEQTFDEGKLADQIEVLSSTTLIERVIEQLNLDRNPEFNPSLRVPEPTLIERVSNYVSVPPEVTDLVMSLGLVETAAPAPDAVETARRERLQIINNVLSGLSLRPIGRSRVIEIGYTSLDPNTSARIANAIGEQYIVDQLEAKLEATRAATDWLSTRVDELRIRVQVAEQAVEATRADFSDQTGQTLDVTQQQLVALNGSLAAARAEVARLQSLYDRLRAALENDRDLGAISEFRESAIIQRLREQESDLQTQRVALEATVSEGHPALARLDQQLQDVRRKMAEEAERIVAAAEIDLNAAKAQEADLTAEVRRLEQKALEQAEDQVTLRQLEREAEASRVLYENFLARLQETTEQESLQEADARILSPAEPPLYPENQAKRRIMLAAVLLGAAVGVGIVFLLDRLNNTFRSPHQLEEMSGLSTLGMLPSIGSRLRRRKIIDHLRTKPASALAEAVRNMRTSILFSNIDNPPKVVMFTSSVPREGKSTSSMLMALTSQQMGKSAIIVDCDLRLPALATLMNADTGETERPGIMAVLDGTAAVEEAVYTDPETGLHVLMTRGSERTSSINAADILSSKKFKELIERLSQSYDLVILDTPPVLVVTDARIVSKLADAVIYTVRWDHTPRGAVLEGLKDLQSIKAPIAGVVMTLVNEEKANRYSYDGYSYYKGRYRNYYAT